jgi:hypothetical protein
MPTSRGADKERKEQQPTPEGQRAIHSLTKYPMQTACMRQAQDEEVTAQPGRHEEPAMLGHAEPNEHDP